MTGSTPGVASGLRRAIWSAILERDIDFTLVDVLHTSPAFRSWLLARVADDLPIGDPATDFLGAWHSVTTPTGESDVEAEWQLREGGRLVVLIEDKIGAAFQPDQGARYMERASNYVASGRAAHTRVVLVAPAGYSGRDPEGAAPFERHLTLEDVRDWCRTDGAGARGAFLAGFLEQALRRAVGGGRRRGTGVLGAPGSTPSMRGGKPQYPEAYEVIEEYLRVRSSSAPHLTSTNSSPGEWVYFSFDGRGKGVSLRWRLRDHWAELVLTSASQVSRDRLERVLASHPLPGGAVAARGTSEVVVWVPTPEVDVLAEVSGQREAVRDALDVVAALATWYSEVGPELDAGAGSAR